MVPSARRFFRWLVVMHEPFAAGLYSRVLSTDADRLVIQEFVRRNLEILRRGTLSHPPADIIDRATARAEPAAVRSAGIASVLPRASALVRAAAASANTNRFGRTCWQSKTTSGSIVPPHAALRLASGRACLPATFRSRVSSACSTSSSRDGRSFSGMPSLVA